MGFALLLHGPPAAWRQHSFWLLGFLEHLKGRCVQKSEGSLLKGQLREWQPSGQNPRTVGCCIRTLQYVAELFSSVSE